MQEVSQNMSGGMSNIQNQMKIDYVKKYHIFIYLLVIWIFFIPIKNSIYQVSTILLSLLSIFHIVYFKKFKNLKNIFILYKDILLAFGVILLSMFLSSVFGLSPLENFADLGKFIYRYIFIFITLLYFYQESFFTRKTLTIILMTVFFVYALDGIYQYFSHYNLYRQMPLIGKGIIGPTFNRNIFGLIMAAGTSLSFFLLLKEVNLKYKILHLFLFLLFLFTLLNTFSRASWMFFAIFAFCHTIFNIKIIFLDKKNIFVFAGCIFFVLSLFLTNQDLFMRLMQLLHGNDTNRYNIWFSSLSFIQNKLFLGYGVGASEQLLKLMLHNLILEILLFLGIVGLLSYSYLFFTIYTEVTKIKLYHYASFLNGFLFLLLFDGSLTYGKIHLSIFIILLFLIYSHRIDKEIQK